MCYMIDIRKIKPTPLYVRNGVRRGICQMVSGKLCVWQFAKLVLSTWKYLRGGCERCEMKVVFVRAGESLCLQTISTYLF